MGNLGIMQLLILPLGLIFYGLPIGGFILAILAFRRVKTLEGKVAELISKSAEKDGSA